MKTVEIEEIVFADAIALVDLIENGSDLNAVREMLKCEGA